MEPVKYPLDPMEHFEIQCCSKEHFAEAQKQGKRPSWRIDGRYPTREAAIEGFKKDNTRRRELQHFVDQQLNKFLYRIVHKRVQILGAEPLDMKTV